MSEDEFLDMADTRQGKQLVLSLRHAIKLNGFDGAAFYLRNLYNLMWERMNAFYRTRPTPPKKRLAMYLEMWRLAGDGFYYVNDQIGSAPLGVQEVSSDVISFLDGADPDALEKISSAVNFPQRLLTLHQASQDEDMDTYALIASVGTVLLDTWDLSTPEGQLFDKVLKYWVYLWDQVESLNQ